jgi:hypothetical protein
LAPFLKAGNSVNPDLVTSFAKLRFQKNLSIETQLGIENQDCEKRKGGWKN